MFITIKLPRKALLLAALGLVLLVVALCLLPLTRQAQPAAAAEDPVTVCLSELERLGWQVEPQPLEVESVLLPENLSQGYLDLQTQAGYDLTPHIGHQVTRYTFPILNYPTDETGVLADLLVLEGKVIGGDVRTGALDGFIHSLCYPS